MVTKSKSKPAVRPHDVKVPPSPKPIPPGVSHGPSVPHGVVRRAQELVHEAGSPPKAKKAIDKAVAMERESDFREDQLAVRWGFKSRQELLAASKPIKDGAGGSWWATRIPDGRWIVWNQDNVLDIKHASIEEAKQSLVNRKMADASGPEAVFPEGFNG